MWGASGWARIRIPTRSYRACVLVLLCECRRMRVLARRAVHVCACGRREARALANVHGDG
eukprot:2677740-Alexandrium_andersonii.AAC.1